MLLHTDLFEVETSSYCEGREGRGKERRRGREGKEEGKAREGSMGDA